ncbi:conjugative transposon protein TraM [Riemerella anatipestifer]|uniref:conjugative transposon protein TraM n=1 Tax=Riemerella anatipestifer TaxID=34085 RepID=UPI0021D5E3BC|nr:conjugative transposon protein TraM [Riemerella anatipestifer]MCU7559131.1 conjugative transposon protein TraM [Riemerella anatipestifer]MCU7571138.1 conjugative transposon protein TraM [Riemerella anatipestifer]MDY3317519.1 conjugative transposon protein TraM [Riemerella anatipestifer]MDY3400703.1 conjugative transposon protein TraM [Riemerella anatipestifer]
MVDFKKINFKQPRYIIPLIALPVILYFGQQVISFKQAKKSEEEEKELATGLGETKEEILSKNEAYDAFYNNKDKRTLIEGLDEERDSLKYYDENLSNEEKRYIDSINWVKSQKLGYQRENNFDKEYYRPPQKQTVDRDYERSAELIRMLNNEASGNGRTTQQNQNYSSKEEYQRQDEQNPIKMMREQMLLLDSLEKSKDPDFQQRALAEKKLKNNRDKMEAFLNSTLKVDKARLNNQFNSITKEKEDTFIKAVIDENLKGYLGSRIRFRLLEDVYVGKNKISKGSILYGQISGFSLQRVNLNIVSILNNGEILPINLTIYDVDGMKGLYVPNSTFREMMRELGQNSIQGTNMDSGGQSFFTSIISRAFSSTSRTIANLIRQNKVKLKYNSYVYLINEKELKNNDNE